MEPKAEGTVFMVRIAIVLIAALVAGCGTAATSRAPTAEPSARAMAEPTATASSDSTACGHATDMAEAGYPHDAPDLEALLPEGVRGRQLDRWSLDGWCWIREGVFESAINEWKLMVEEESVDVMQMRYAVAGRSNVANDPPYFVHVMEAPTHDATAELAFSLFLGNIGVLDVATFNKDLELATVSGKEIWILDAEFMAQDEHQAGSAYLYDTGDLIYAVITDDEAWAADALSQLE